MKKIVAGIITSLIIGTSVVACDQPSCAKPPGGGNKSATTKEKATGPKARHDIDWDDIFEDEDPSPVIVDSGPREC